MLRRLCCCLDRGSAAEKASKVNSSTADTGTKQQNASNPEDSRKQGNAGSKAAKSSQGAVLVEMFTSQGCTSCPSADLLISKVGGGKSEEVALEVPIVVLAFHVDYWDYLGWRDPFASSAWTLRQRSYGQALQQDSIYTPEVVVQGRSHCIASAIDPILGLIHSAPRFSEPEIKATFERLSELSLQVSLQISLKIKVDTFALDVMVAIYQNGLVTNCERGENKGRMLTNDFVVRGLEKACTLKDWPSKKPVNAQVTFSLWEGYAKTKSGVAVFFQNPVTMEAYGAQLLNLPD